MALCSDCTARIEYQGNGSQTDYTFPFEYYEISEINVSVYNPNTLAYSSLQYQTDWILVNPTTIRLKRAQNTEVVIYRCTDIDPMRATFAPGTPIKAAELNDNFDQLRNAIEEGRCNAGDLQDQITEGKDIFLNRIDADLEWNGRPGDLVKSRSSLTLDDDHVASTKWIDNRYWDQCDETTYASDRWADEIDDVHIPTTRAVEQRLADFQALTGVQKVTGYMQRNQQWDASVTNDDNVATTDALVERFDHELGSSNDAGSAWLQPGKIWIKSDTAELFYRRAEGTQWIQLDTKGDKGDPGEDGEDSTVPGPEGPSGTITIGDTTTGDPGTDAEVVNTGTPENAVLEFTIPKGEKGDPGDGTGEILTFTAPLVKTGTVVSLDLLTIPNAP